MALTQYTSSINSAVQKQVYARKAFLWATENNFFAPFTGRQVTALDSRTGDKKNAIQKVTGTNSIITLRDDLSKQRGETINFHILAPLTGDGVVNDEILTNNEETMSYYNMSATVNQRRNGVKVGGMSKQRTFVDVLADAKELLQLWIAGVIELDTLLSLSGLANSVGTITANAPSTNRHFVGGQTTAGVVTSNGAAALDLNDATNELFGTAVISWIKRKAMTVGSGYPKLRPIMYKGKPYYVMLIHPLQNKALRVETSWINANKDGWIRGVDNPIFSGAEGIWDGVLIHEYERIETRLGDASGDASTDPSAYFELTDGAANGILNARALFLGAQAAVHASAKNISMETEKKDYGNQTGVAVGMIWQAAKTEFNSEDYGVIPVDTCVVADS